MIVLKTHVNELLCVGYVFDLAVARSDVGSVRCDVFPRGEHGSGSERKDLQETLVMELHVSHERSHRRQSKNPDANLRPSVRFYSSIYLDFTPFSN